MRKRTWNMLLSLCLIAALLCSTCAFAAGTVDEEQLENSVVLSDGEEPDDGIVPSDNGEPDDGAVPSDGEEPDDGAVPPDGEEPADGINPGIMLLDLEAEHEHDYVAGKCACGDILPAYEWYYGSTGKYYYIETAEEMVALADVVNSLGYTFAGETVCLTEDVDLTGIDWVPIANAEKEDLTLKSQAELDAAVEQYFIVYDSAGNSYSSSDRDASYSSARSYYSAKPGVFSGTFDGGGHTISGMSFSTDLGYAGLFGNVNGTLQDFTISGHILFTGANGDYIGGAAGMLAMGGRISGVTADVYINAGYAWNVGGIAGFVGTPLSADSARNTVVTMCVNEGFIIGCKKVGGITGENAGMITLCVNHGQVMGVVGTSKNGTGGIAGRNGNNNTAIEAGTISSCYNTGTISSGGKWLGGITGFNNSKSSVENCYNTSRQTTGGLQNPIIGWLESTLCGNNYTLRYDNVDYSTGYSEEEVGIVVTSDELAALVGTVIIDGVERSLGDDYVADSSGINDGYPILAWQAGEVEGYQVTVDNRTGTAAITGVTNSATYSGSVTFTVSGDLPCVAVYTTDGGETYTRLTGAANASGGYNFTVNVTGPLEIAVALKGDANGDGKVNVADVIRVNAINIGKVINPMNASLYSFVADANDDGTVNVADVIRLNAANIGKVSLTWN